MPHTAPVAWKTELLDQLEFYRDGYLLPKLAGLTNEEFFWEPVAHCWTVHRHEDGSFRVDLPRRPEPQPPPFTTIAWRLTHVIMVLGERSSRQFGDNTYSRDTMTVPGNAADAQAELLHRMGLWTEGIRALTEEDLGRPTGPTERHHTEAPLATLILHVHREVMHHGGEICLLRDLYRNRHAWHSGDE